MSKTQFDVKTYQGKDRVYVPVPSKVGILRLYIWSKTKKKYVDPSGKKYDARRVEIGENGKKRRKKKTFNELNQAIRWQQGNDSVDSCSNSFVTLSQFVNASSEAKGMTFKELIADFKLKRLKKLELSTQNRYNRLLDQYFCGLNNLVVKELRPAAIDLWLEDLRVISESANRKFFKHELDLLKNLVGHYKEYYDEDNKYILPFRKRHSADAKNGHIAKETEDLSHDEFLSFREKLLGLKHGGKLWLLVTIEFYQALRVSESAALRFEDFRFRSDRPQESELIVSAALKWRKDTGPRPELGGNSIGKLSKWVWVKYFYAA